uniref:Uncharacterized protein n=1 Tax=Strongyloides venezuelensis TaxID=75913 RepID=A0A0K0EXS9_STRVS
MMNSTLQRRNLALRQLSSNAVTFARYFPVDHEKMETKMDGTQAPTIISGKLKKYIHKKVLQPPSDSLLNKLASGNKKNKRRAYSMEEGDKRQRYVEDKTQIFIPGNVANSIQYWREITHDNEVLEIVERFNLIFNHQHKTVQSNVVYASEDLS